MSTESDRPAPGMEGYWSALADEEDRESEQGNARYYGMKAEEYAAERFGYHIYETGHSDALVPHDDPERERREHLPGTRTKVQIKGARLRIKDSTGSGGRLGRFRLWESDHEELDDEDLYLFLGYDPDQPVPVRMTRHVPVGDLADAVDGLNWYDAQHSTKRGRPTDINVRLIFPHIDA